MKAILRQMWPFVHRRDDRRSHRPAGAEANAFSPDRVKRSESRAILLATVAAARRTESARARLVSPVPALTRRRRRRIRIAACLREGARAIASRRSGAARGNRPDRLNSADLWP